MVNIFKDKEFLEHWYLVESDGTFENELYKDFGESRVLYGKKLFAMRYLTDQQISKMLWLEP